MTTERVMDCGVIGEGPEKQAQRVKFMSGHATQLLEETKRAGYGLYLLGDLLMERAGKEKGLDEIQLEGLAQIVLALNDSVCQATSHHGEAIERFARYAETGA